MSFSVTLFVTVLDVIVLLSITSLIVLGTMICFTWPWYIVISRFLLPWLGIWSPRRLAKGWLRKHSLNYSNVPWNYSNCSFCEFVVLNHLKTSLQNVHPYIHFVTYLVELNFLLSRACSQVSDSKYSCCSSSKLVSTLFSTFGWEHTSYFAGYTRGAVQRQSPPMDGRD